MEIYCSFKNYKTKDVSLVKEQIVDVFAKKQLIIEVEEILYENGILSVFMLTRDIDFKTFEQINFFLDSLIVASIKLGSRFSAFSIPDLNIMQTHYN